MKRIINVETGEITERELNADELAQQEIDSVEILAERAARKADEKAKATAKSALLAKLGITEDEAKLLLG